MKYIYTFLALTLIYMANAQFNMSQLGHIDIVASHSNSEANDIWGYVDGSGNEYAIVGLNDGTSIVDVSDPANLTEVFYENGMNSIWRDIKTFGNYAYVTTEAKNGLLIMDLTSLPNAAGIVVNYYTGPTGDEWESAHNLYIDENGFCYIFGADRGNGGTIILDLNSDPMNPTEVGIEDMYYTHDGVVRGDTLYEAHINDGFFTIWDISTKSSPVLLGQNASPGNFSHNLWFSDDGDYVYTTDEITNGFIGEYDISDPLNIIETDIIQSSPGMDVIPHNAHFFNDYIVTSYYRDGVVIHDVSNKGNMIEVGNYDTAPTMAGDGFNGCWGVYPWLPSGNIIASDIENGLHVLGVTYQRGCYLEGTITDQSNSNPINAATISIFSTTVQDNSDILGNYATGIATAGTYDVIYSHPAYYDDTIFGLSLSNGVTLTQDVQLIPITPMDVDFSVSEGILSVQIPDVSVVMSNDDFTHTGFTNNSGLLTITGVIPGNYDVVISKWGFVTQCSSIIVDNTTSTISTALINGYYDDFTTDFNWQVTGAAPDGVWERGEPNGTTSGGMESNPELDFNSDCGDQAYITGNSATGGLGSDDVDIADVILTSPSMDLTTYAYPQLDCKIWWQNFGGSGTPDDSLKIFVDNGIEKVMMSFYTENQSDESWQSLTLNVWEYITITNNMTISFETADWQSGAGHIVEAGVDVFTIVENPAGGLNEEELIFSMTPNPSNGLFQINFDNTFNDAHITILDLSGRVILTQLLSTQKSDFLISNSGVYLVRINQGNNTITKKLIIQ